MHIYEFVVITTKEHRPGQIPKGVSRRRWIWDGEKSKSIRYHSPSHTQKKNGVTYIVIPTKKIVFFFLLLLSFKTKRCQYCGVMICWFYQNTKTKTPLNGIRLNELITFIVSHCCSIATKRIHLKNTTKVSGFYQNAHNSFQ